MTPNSPISRSTLLKLLTEACELEHGLACSYLYSAMSLRQEPFGAMLSAAEVLLVRQWASQVYFVASQEMLHLAQAWNLLVAVGGTPYYLRPNFPQRTNYYPLHMRLALEPYGEAALKRFIGYEKPLELLAEHSFVKEIVKPRSGAPTDFHTIGELYATIERGIAELPDAIIGNPDDQVGTDIVDFQGIVRVVDVDSARQAIALVTHQGEGNQTDRADCHFGIFISLLEALQKAKKLNPQFTPAYPAMTNPSVDTSAGYGAPQAKPITDPFAIEVAGLFDGLYSLMLRMLGYTFSPGGDLQLKRALAQGAIVLMATVLKPLGEGLMQLPSAPGASSTAGPPFGLTRHVTLPVDALAAGFLVSERLEELTAVASKLAAPPAGPAALGKVAAILRRLSSLSGFELSASTRRAVQERQVATFDR